MLELHPRRILENCPPCHLIRPGWQRSAPRFSAPPPRRYQGPLSDTHRLTLPTLLLASGGRGLASPNQRAGMRVVFTAYLVLITVCLVFYIAIGITNHQ
jgi:hypothetical protein